MEQNPSPVEGNEVEHEGRFSSEWFSWGESMMAVLVFFVLIFTFVIRIIGVDGSSMHPTLENHNIMLVSNLGYRASRGDVVILRKQSFFGGQPIVKRIIAVGGDEINIDSQTGDVSVNGEVLDEPYIAEKIDVLTRLGDQTYPLVVPEGHIFVMGDNRNGSTDSRMTMLGVVDERCILGHALQVVYPFDRFARIR